MEVTNKQLLQYAKVLFDFYYRKFLNDGKYVRINIYTKQSNFVVVSLYFVDDKSMQGISFYEGNEMIDEPVEKPQITENSFYVARYNNAEYWTEECARKDLESATTQDVPA